MVRAHGHLPAEDFLVVFPAHGNHRDVPTGFGDNLQSFFDRVIVGFVHRIDQLVALDIVSRAVKRDLVFRGVRHSSCTNQNFHSYLPATLSCWISTVPLVPKTGLSRIICFSVSSARSMAVIFPSMPATLIASSILTMQNGQAVTITFAPASAAIRTRFTPIRSSSFGS